MIFSEDLSVDSGAVSLLYPLYVHYKIPHHNIHASLAIRITYVIILLEVAKSDFKNSFFPCEFFSSYAKNLGFFETHTGVNWNEPWFL